jgi:hypothetical protein
MRLRRSSAMARLADFPLLLSELHPTKNRDLGFSPRDLSAGSQRIVWWRCYAGPDHEWQRKVAARTLNAGCPFCANYRVSVTNALSVIAPAVARQWHPTKNGALRPRDVVASSERKVWWKCPKGPDHAWQSTIRNRAILGQGCPQCLGKLPSVTNSLASLAPALAAEWHPTKNGALTPHDVTTGSTRVVWWKCPADPEHEWPAALSSRAKRGGHGCPCCSGHRITAKTSLAARRPKLAAEWHPTKNGALLPTQVGPRVKRDVWWKCPKGPDHEWKAVVQSRVTQPKCPFCIGLRLSVTNSLARVYPKLARQWHPTKNGDLTPEAVRARSSKQYWWQCAFGHAWVAGIWRRAHLGNGCPQCAPRKHSQLLKRRARERIRLASYEEAPSSRARRR